MRPHRSSVPTLLALVLAACSSDIPGRVTAPAEPSKVVLVPVCVTFDPFAIGSSAGGPFGDSPGDVIFTENGISVSVHKFYHPAPNPPSFGVASVQPAFPGFGSVHIAEINNINLGFDFSGIGFVPSSVTFEWRDHGGHENLKVNASGVYVGELIAAPSPLGGVTVAHVWAWAPGGAFKQGTTTLTGAVSTIGVGGQEWYLDNVCANP
jgi:hypothetical protein